MLGPAASDTAKDPESFVSVDLPKGREGSNPDSILPSSVLVCPDRARSGGGSETHANLAYRQAQCHSRKVGGCAPMLRCFMSLFGIPKSQLQAPSADNNFHKQALVRFFRGGGGVLYGMWADRAGCMH